MKKVHTYNIYADADADDDDRYNAHIISLILWFTVWLTIPQSGKERRECESSRQSLETQHMIQCWMEIKDTTHDTTLNEHKYTTHDTTLDED